MIHIAQDGVYQDGVKISHGVEDAGWNQGVLEMQGLYQKSTQKNACHKRGHTYEWRMKGQFVPGAGLLFEYVETPDPGCPKCVKRKADQ